MKRTISLMAALALAGCTFDAEINDDAALAADGGVAQPDAATDEPDASSEPDAPVEPVCGSEHLPVADIRGTEGIAVAPDGTFYYSQNGAIGRRRPGEAPDDQWVDVPNTTTIYGLAYDDASGMVYVAAVSSKKIFKIDTNAASPTATVLYTPANGCNGLIIGPDGAIYYSGGGGNVYRVSLQGQATQVNGDSLPGANGLYFESASKLLVLEYGNRQVWQLTLDGSMHETSRMKIVTVAGSQGVDGIARDEAGNWYIGDNRPGRLIRFKPDWSGQETLLDDVPAAANVVFGRGALDCKDVYVASGDKLGRYKLP
jgi:sugar lactone lactonase YvrE